MRQPRRPKIPKREWEHGFAYARFPNPSGKMEWEIYPKKYEDATGCFLQMMYFVYLRFKAGQPVAVYYQLFQKDYNSVKDTD